MVKNLGRPSKRIQDRRWINDAAKSDNHRAWIKEIKDLGNPEYRKRDSELPGGRKDNKEFDRFNEPLYQGPIVDDTNKTDYHRFNEERLQDMLLKKKGDLYKKGWSY